jgi:hypothetical protein
MPPRNAIILVDTVAIKGAHEAGCWNAMRKAYQLHSVSKCVEEATRPNRRGERLVSRDDKELGAEITLGAVSDLMRAKAMLRIGHRTDVDEGERDLLAYALTLPANIWWLCGPDNGTVNALQFLGLLDRMVTLEALARGCGHAVKNLPAHYTERWLSARRTKFLLEGTE